MTYFKALLLNSKQGCVYNEVYSHVWGEIWNIVTAQVEDKAWQGVQNRVGIHVKRQLYETSLHQPTETS
jgi:hypothetical protein